MSKANRPDYRRMAQRDNRRQREQRKERHFEDLRRENLAEFAGRTTKFLVRVERIGKTKFGNMEDTVLLKNIRTINGRSLCDHLWVKKAHVNGNIPRIGTNTSITALVYGYVTERRGNFYREKFSFKDIVFAG